MKFMVTGAGGQLGKEWVRFLSKQGASFKAFGSRDLDITIPGQVTERFKKESPDVVINCAAYTNVDQAEKEPEKAFLVNETGVKMVADACTRTGAKLVHYSTDYVFSGDMSDMDIYPDGYPEDAVVNPVNTYGSSKRAGEIILQNSGVTCLLVRVSWLCGLYGKNFVKTMIKLGNKKTSLDVVNDQTGSPSFTFDVVEKTNQLLEVNQKGLFHISSSGRISWAEFAKEIFHQTGQDVVVNEISSSEFKVTARRPAFSLLKNKRATDLGLRQTEWKAGLNKLIQQLQHQKQ